MKSDYSDLVNYITLLMYLVNGIHIEYRMAIQEYQHTVFCMHITHYMLVKCNYSRNSASELSPGDLNKGVVYPDAYTLERCVCTFSEKESQ